MPGLLALEDAQTSTGLSYAKAAIVGGPPFFEATLKKQTRSPAIREFRIMWR